MIEQSNGEVYENMRQLLVRIHDPENTMLLSFRRGAEKALESSNAQKQQEAQARLDLLTKLQALPTLPLQLKAEHVILLTDANQLLNGLLMTPQMEASLSQFSQGLKEKEIGKLMSSVIQINRHLENKGKLTPPGQDRQYGT